MRKEKLQIKLADIPENGKTFEYSRESSELDVSLNELIGTNDYKIEFTIRPIGNVYELNGSLDTVLTRQCSQCGYDLEIPLNVHLNEILMHKEEEHRGDSTSKKGFISEAEENDDLSVTFVAGGVLDADEFIHEAVAYNDPAYPSCEKTKCENLEEVKRKMVELEKEAESALGKKDSPFSVLKNIKLQ